MPNRYRSKLEERVANQLQDKGVELIYEDKGDRLGYTCLYQPDFRLPNGILIECKGYHQNFKQALSKLIKVNTQNPDIDLRILWDNAYMKGCGTKDGRSMLAWEWSEKNNFKWAHKVIPDSWLEE